MISVEKAKQMVLDHISILEPVSIPFLDSLGMVLAETIVSDDDIPPFDMVTTDGFALRSADVSDSNQRNPASLIIDGDVKVGNRWKSIVKSGHALKVEEGAPLPEGADTVISSDDAVRKNSKRVMIYKHEKPGQHIFIRGGDIEAGSIVLPKGKVLNASDIGILAAIGKTEVLCHRRPRVSFFASGNDLVPIDQPHESSKLRASNTFTLQAQLSEYGAEPVNLGIFGVVADELERCIEKAINADMIIISAGSSPADFDKIKLILQRIGMDLKFWKVAIRPGKPVIFGMLNGTPAFGISSNELSFVVILEQFIRPAILKMQGKRENRRTEVVARLDRDVKGGGGITHFVRAEVRVTDDGFLAIPAGSGKSPSVGAFSSANGFIVIPEEMNYIAAGEMVRVQIISDPADLN